MGWPNLVTETSKRFDRAELSHINTYLPTYLSYPPSRPRVAFRGVAYDTHDTQSGEGHRGEEIWLRFTPVRSFSPPLIPDHNQPS